ncbi:MAG: hypothetical protein QM271_10880, partial [Bacillota bacterium]|nr:hypothetical protein [Bacillota bacterium]
PLLFRQWRPAAFLYSHDALNSRQWPLASNPLPFDWLLLLRLIVTAAIIPMIIQIVTMLTSFYYIISTAYWWL